MTQFKAPVKHTEENKNEMYFRWYCEELKKYGYLEDFHREPETFIVSGPIPYKMEEHLQTKTKVKEFNLFSQTNYTYDTRMIWTEKAKYIFYDIIELDGTFKYGKPLFIAHQIELNGEIKTVSYVDVKPHYKASNYNASKLRSYFSFPFIQKWLFLIHRIYVNKIIPVHIGSFGKTTCLFAITFVPNRYRFHDKAEGLRKIPYKKHTIESFVKNKENAIKAIEKLINARNNQTSLL